MKHGIYIYREKCGTLGREEDGRDGDDCWWWG